VLPVAVSRPAGRTTALFLCPYQQRASADRQVRVSVPACPPDVPDYLVAIVLISAAGEVHGLTPRELQILGRTRYG
jgi:hypothetical protein